MGIATGSTRALYFSIEKGGGPGPRGTKGTEPFEKLKIYFPNAEYAWVDSGLRVDTFDGPFSDWTGLDTFLGCSKAEFRK